MILDCCENGDDEAMEQWINEDSTLECCEVLSDYDNVSRVTCDSEETKNFEECPESDEENLVIHQKLSHGDALVHTEALLNYLEQEDESTAAEKMILRNLRNIIRRRGGLQHCSSYGRAATAHACGYYKSTAMFVINMRIRQVCSFNKFCVWESIKYLIALTLSPWYSSFTVTESALGLA
ncbi:hypothetical protein AVEN_242281-1 [Araneus ventricosus]|uniref:Uncharacterized protein n=1 Tax=Araneus ventricosus TaxID=182803 RepID=A0A4Y2SZV5_ARAVE|nr:hypothetical protein AVEN_242281-1 [Araneus ventricosus]